MNVIEAVLTAGGASGATFVANWAVMKWRIGQIEKDQEKMKTNFDERLVGLSASKKATVKTLKDDFEKQEIVLNKRIDKTQEKLDAHIKDTNKEFKDLTQEIGSVKGLCEAIDGKLGMLIKFKGE